jgi:hypothetical protein
MAIVVPTLINSVPVVRFNEPTHRKDWYMWTCPGCDFKVERMVDTMPDSPTDFDMLCYRCTAKEKTE